MQSFYQLMDRRGSSGRILYAYEPDTYKRILASVKQCAADYKKYKKDKSKNQRDRLERLENLASVLYKELTHNQDKTVSFDKSELKRCIGKKFSEAEVLIVLSGVRIEEKIGVVTVPFNFLVEYGVNGRHEFGYLIPKVRN